MEMAGMELLHLFLDRLQLMLAAVEVEVAQVWVVVELVALVAAGMARKAALVIMQQLTLVAAVVVQDQMIQPILPEGMVDLAS